MHRDVKPANIMVTNPGGGLTATNLTVGTVAYSAPEQLMGLDIDGRPDQYALAATAYHRLTGSQLFPNFNPRRRHQPPPQRGG